MRICKWSDLLEGGFRLCHVYSQETHPRFTLQGCGDRPRSTNGVVFYCTGTARVLPKGVGVMAPPGSLLCYPAGSRYRAVVEVPGTAFQQVEFTLTDAAGEECGLGTEPNVVFEDCPGAIRLKVKEMVRVHQYGGLGSSLQSNGLLYDLVYHLALEKFTEETELSGFRRILPAILYLEQHFVEDLTVTDLADMSNMSETGFRRLFRRYSGVAPVKYRNDLRIRRACDLLRVGEHNVSEVAELTGFGSVYYFSRAFKKATGKTPGSVLRSS